MLEGRFWSLLSFLLLASIGVQAQFMDYGSDPQRFKWNIVKLPHYNLIYPQGNDSMAYRYALYLENVYPHVEKTIGKPQKATFPVILHPANMRSNGMVSWAPRRMELITTPSSDLGIEQWDKHLVLHESRHVFQTGKVLSGIFKPFYYILGEQAAGIASFFLPTWYLEGDAVSTETALSNGGRGRLPEFNMTYRAQLLAGHKKYSFDKWLLGSYKDYTGSFYALGYNMTSYARQRYGANIWDKSISRYTHNILFERSFKHFTGSGVKRLYSDTFDYLEQGWTKIDTLTAPPTFLSPEAKSFTSYRYPQLLNDSTVLAVKTSLKDLNSLVSLCGSKEERLTYIGSINSRLNLINGYIYWTEYTPGLRWAHENYSVLKRYDLAKNRITTLTPNQRYLSPAINASGSLVAVSNPQTNGVNEVVLLQLNWADKEGEENEEKEEREKDKKRGKRGGRDASDASDESDESDEKDKYKQTAKSQSLKCGDVLASFTVPNNGFVKELTFTPSNNVVAVVVDDSGNNLYELETGMGSIGIAGSIGTTGSIGTAGSIVASVSSSVGGSVNSGIAASSDGDNRFGTWHKLLSVPSANLTSPRWYQNKLYFESGASGTNNIYYLDPADLSVYRVTQARFGAFDPLIDEASNRLLYADYQAQGYRIATINADQLINEKSDLLHPTPLPFVETLAEQEGYNVDEAQLEPVPFDAKPYNKVLHTFKIHSWAPFYYNISDALQAGADDFMTLVKPGATILSQNSLNTATMQAGWYYSKGYNHGALAFNYQGWFPVIDITADYGDKAIDIAWVTDGNGAEQAKGYKTRRNLIDAEARVYLPFNLSRNDRIRGIQPALTYSFSNNRYQQVTGKEFRNFQYFLPELRLYNYRRMAYQDLLPRWGYQLRLQYLQSPFNTDNFGSLYATRLTTYWPGVLRNQGLMVRMGYQYQSVDGKALYLPTHLIESTRGYGFLYQTRQQWSVKGDYALTICSPDLSLGSLIYIRRLRANLFYDFTQNQASKQSDWSTQSSAGVDLTFDWNVLRMSYPLTTGVRLTQPIDYGYFQAEMLFSVSF